MEQNKSSSSEGKVKLAGKDVDRDKDFNPFSIKGKDFEYMQDFIKKAKKESSINKDFANDTKAVYADLQKSGYFSEQGVFNEKKALAKGDLSKVKSWSKDNPSLILEVADNSKIRCYERTNSYDAGSQHVEKHKLNLETAEDDRVLGIPYAQAMAGDRVYIVNGKVFTGWALYFSLSSIKSPEDYGRNVDLVWNVPYLYSSILLKAQLGLGTGIDVNYGAESNEVAEEKLIRRYLFDRLKLNTQKLIKTGFHLYTYGNSYWSLRRDTNGIVDKITILQPERMKIFLDPMTTKIMFYIYLPPVIGGTTIASYPSDGRVNPNVLTGVTLSYPTPIVIHPEDICHFKIQDFTEYPFGFSDVKSCLDPATARLDVNILAPILYKKYTKPMIHWAMNTEGLGPKQIETKQGQMTDMLEGLEPGSDPVTTDMWKPTIINNAAAGTTILDLTGDIDTQIFAATGVPETYFKSKGSTDRMISEQDKTFISRLKIPQTIVGDQIEDKIIKPRIFHELSKKKAIKDYMGATDVVDKILDTYDSWLASEPKYPKVSWKETFKNDETQSIANAIALLNAGIIDQNRAAQKIGEIPPVEEAKQNQNKVGIDDPMDGNNPVTPMNSIPHPQTDGLNGDMQDKMGLLRGSLNANGNGKFATSNRNTMDVQDPSQLGGSRYQQQNLKGNEADIHEKSSHQKKPDVAEGDEVELIETSDVVAIIKKNGKK